MIRIWLHFVCLGTLFRIGICYLIITRVQCVKLNFDNYNISLSFTYGRSVVFFANKTDHQEITDSVNNHKTNTFLQEYRVYIVFFSKF
jgi:hypothetical protein